MTVEERIKNDVEEIVNASKGVLNFLNIEDEDISVNQKTPVIIIQVETTGVLAGVDNDRQIRSFDPSIMALDIMPRREIGESDIFYEQKLYKREGELKDLIEQILFFLTEEEFKFKYEFEGDLLFTSLREVTDNELFGVEGIFNLRKAYHMNECCFSFDESLLK